MKTYQKTHTNKTALQNHVSKIKKRGGKYVVKNNTINYVFSSAEIKNNKIKDVLELELQAIPNTDFDPSDWEARVKIKKHRIFVSSIDDASKKARKFCVDNDLGGGNFVRANLYKNGKKIGYISYNGKFWKE